MSAPIRQIASLGTMTKFIRIQHFGIANHPCQRAIVSSIELIAHYLSAFSTGSVVELGSGIGNIKEVIPTCMRTDLFQNPWLDRVENVYDLSFESASVSDLILFDVFHHLIPWNGIRRIL